MGDIDRKLREQLLGRIEAEAERVNQLLDQLQLEMERIPPAARRGPHWEAFTARFMNLQSKHGQLVKRMARTLWPPPRGYG